VAKSYWGKGIRTLHLDYWTASDTVGGTKIIGRDDLFYFIEWDTNSGDEYKFAESDIDEMVARVRRISKGDVRHITRMVNFG
jgi:hypothetical protein